MNTQKSDITSLEDIKLMVNSFYDQVRKDDLIGPIFHARIQNDWQPHLEKMYRFWQTVLLNQHTYSGRPFPPHAQLPVEKKHFDRWVNLFHQTVDKRFEGPQANEAKWRATKMAQLFESKIAYHRQRQNKPLF